MLNQDTCKLQPAFATRQHSRQWHPFPDARNREAWRTIPAEFQASILEHAGQNVGKPWETLSARLLAEYVRDGVRGRADAVLRRRIDRIGSAALAWAISGEDVWGDDLTDGLLLLMEQTSWCAPAHESLPAGRQLPSPDAPFLDLTAGYTASLLAYCDQIVGPWIEQRDTQFRSRIGHEVRRRVLSPFVESDWWWMGEGSGLPNNWNPWIVSSVLAAAQSFADDVKAEQGQPSELDRIIERSLPLLDKYLDVCPEDGSCEEGAAYWWWAGACVFDALRILEGCTGVSINPVNIPRLRNMPGFVRHMAVSETWNLNFGDAPPMHPDDARWNHLQQFANYVGDTKTADFAMAMRNWEPIYGSDRGKTFGRVLAELFGPADPARSDVKVGVELDTDIWLPSVQIFAAREDPNGSLGFHVGAKGGNNGASHNHNDVGNFTVAFDGEPLVIDIGAEKYNSLTFSKDRYTIWTNRSAWHNVPLIAGREQLAGHQYGARNAAVISDAGSSSLTMDLAAAYPTAAGLDSFVRSVSLHRDRGSVEVHDVWEGLGDETVHVAWHLMLCNRPIVLDSGVIMISDKVELRYSGATARIALDVAPVHDEVLRSIWGTELFRLRLIADIAPRRGEMKLEFAQS